jgi:membrane-bound serine protease (ClpP class)
VLLLGAVLLAVFVLPTPWGIAAVAAAALVEIAETLVLVRLSRRPRSRVGAEALIGASGETVSECRPAGQVRVDGELWQAWCEAGAAPGERVRVTARDGLTLVVEPDGDSIRSRDATRT